MAITTPRGGQIKDGSIQRVDLDVTTVGQAVIAKAVQGFGISLSSTGGDAGTGDVTIAVNPDIDLAHTVAQTTAINDAVTNAATTLLILSHNTTGTPAANLGCAIEFKIESSTTPDTSAGLIEVQWSDVTHITRASFIDFMLCNGGTPTSKMRLHGSGGLSVGATSDPTAGIINANTGFRIANAASNGKILMGNSSAFVVSTAGFPTAAPAFGDQLYGDGTNWVASPGGRTVITAQVDQTAVTETAHISFTVPANMSREGSTYRITAWGNIDNGTTAITFTPRLRWGGTGGVQLLATPTIVGTTTTTTNAIWWLEAIVTIWTIGATGTCMCSVALENHTAVTAGVWKRDVAATNSVVTIDTTANKNLVLSWTLSATTGAPHLRTNGGVIEQLK